MKTVLTIGSYDGVHLGHQKLLKRMLEYSREKLLIPVVIYFPLPPRLYLSGHVFDNLITTPLEREKLIKFYGIDKIIKLDFNEDFSRISARDFFINYILKYNPSIIVVGKDFAIGKNREGNLKWLYETVENYSINIDVVDFEKYKEHKISSSIIRSFLHRGMVKEAAICLGRRYSINGIVIKGAGIGRKIGYKTANLDVDKYKILPKGVYAVKVSLNEKIYDGVASIGIRPTLNTLENKLIAEVHIIDFDKDIYGKEICIEFIEKIRNELKFKSVSQLIMQIEKDIILAKNILKNTEKTI